MAKILALARGLVPSVYMSVMCDFLLLLAVFPSEHNKPFFNASHAQK